MHKFYQGQQVTVMREGTRNTRIKLENGKTLRVPNEELSDLPPSSIAEEPPTDEITVDPPGEQKNSSQLQPERTHGQEKPVVPQPKTFRPQKTQKTSGPQTYSPGRLPKRAAPHVPRSAQRTADEAKRLERNMHR